MVFACIENGNCKDYKNVRLKAGGALLGIRIYKLLQAMPFHCLRFSKYPSFFALLSDGTEQQLILLSDAPRRCTFPNSESTNRE